MPHEVSLGPDRETDRKLEINVNDWQPPPPKSLFYFRHPRLRIVLRNYKTCEGLNPFMNSDLNPVSRLLIDKVSNLMVPL